MFDPKHNELGPGGGPSSVGRDLYLEGEVRYASGPQGPPARTSVHEILAVVVRRLGLISVILGTTIIAVIAFAFLAGQEYESEFKVLIKHERADPVVTAEANAPAVEIRNAVSEEEINSEVALMKSRDLLAEVVQQCALDAPGTHFWSGWQIWKWRNTPAVRAEKALRRLAANLRVEPVRRSNLIEVSYRANQPALVMKVLQTVFDLYMAKRAALHKSQGAFRFFENQADKYRDSLSGAEKTLADFERRNGTAAPQVERDVLLQKVAELRVSSAQATAALEAARERKRSLAAQLAVTPNRIQTQVKTSENGQLLEKLKTSLLALELKRTELASRYESTYLPIRELDAQIAQTREALQAEETRPLRDNSTDQNPTYQWLSDELAKATAELPGLEAQAELSRRNLEDMRGRALALNSDGLAEQDILRNIKTEEKNYLLYAEKREEARIADELDNTRISNVVLAEGLVAPYLPVRSPLLILGVGTLFCVFLGVGTAFAVDYFDPTLRTRSRVEQYLDMPVLATFPLEAAGPGTWLCLSEAGTGLSKARPRTTTEPL